MARKASKLPQDVRNLVEQSHGSLTVTLPLPTQILGPNGRAGWRAKHKAFQAAKTLAYCEFVNLMPNGRPEWPDPISVIAKWYYKFGQPPDIDNAISRLKVYGDSAEAAGVFLNDNQIIRWDVTFVRTTDEPHIELTFERA